MIYYVIPRELAHKYYKEFKKRFAGVEGVEVIIDRRESDRRASSEGGEQRVLRDRRRRRPAARSRTCDTWPVSGLRLDLHNHTSFSSDGVMSPAELLERGQARAASTASPSPITTPCEGALRALELCPRPIPALPRVIPGIEISTADGEVIGLYVREDIPAGLSAGGGRGPHPRAGGTGLPAPSLRRVPPREPSPARVRDSAARQADLVEVLNGRSLGPRAGAKSSARLARAPRQAGRRRAATPIASARWGEPAWSSSDYPPGRPGGAGRRRSRAPRAAMAWEYLLNWGLQASSPW